MAKSKLRIHPAEALENLMGEIQSPGAYPVIRAVDYPGCTGTRIAVQAHAKGKWHTFSSLDRLDFCLMAETLRQLLEESGRSDRDYQLAKLDRFMNALQTLDRPPNHSWHQAPLFPDEDTQEK